MAQGSSAMDVVPLWIITFNPSDFPGKYVVRRHEVRAGKSYGPTLEFNVADTLDEVRGFVPGWAIRFDRQLEDDPVIVESWI